MSSSSVSSSDSSSRPSFCARQTRSKVLPPRILTTSPGNCPEHHQRPSFEGVPSPGIRGIAPAAITASSCLLLRRLTTRGPCLCLLLKSEGNSSVHFYLRFRCRGRRRPSHRCVQALSVPMRGVERLMISHIYLFNSGQRAETRQEEITSLPGKCRWHTSSEPPPSSASPNLFIRSALMYGSVRSLPM